MNEEVRSLQQTKLTTNQPIKKIPDTNKTKPTPIQEKPKPAERKAIIDKKSKTSSNFNTNDEKKGKLNATVKASPTVNANATIKKVRKFTNNT